MDKNKTVRKEFLWSYETENDVKYVWRKKRRFLLSEKCHSYSEAYSVMEFFFCVRCRYDHRVEGIVRKDENLKRDARKLGLE